MYRFEEGLMADERKLNEQPSKNKDYYYYLVDLKRIYELKMLTLLVVLGQR